MDVLKKNLMAAGISDALENDEDNQKIEASAIKSIKGNDLNVPSNHNIQNVTDDVRIKCNKENEDNKFDVNNEDEKEDYMYPDVNESSKREAVPDAGMKIADDTENEFKEQSVGMCRTEPADEISNDKWSENGSADDYRYHDAPETYGNRESVSNETSKDDSDSEAGTETGSGGAEKPDKPNNTFNQEKPRVYIPPYDDSNECKCDKGVVRWVAFAAGVLVGILIFDIGICMMKSHNTAKSNKCVESQAEDGCWSAESGVAGLFGTDADASNNEDINNSGTDGIVRFTVPTTAVPTPNTAVNDVSAIVEDAMPSVVAISSKVVYTQDSFFFGRQVYEAEGSGSGIIIGNNEDELLIVTNGHVVSSSEETKVTFSDGESVEASIKGVDTDSDLAVLAVQMSDIKENTFLNAIKVATIGNSDDLKLGQGVVAIGNALGEGQSVTVGYVSALNKEVEADGIKQTYIQVDAAINPGNSGGALLNMNGELIGINSAKVASTSVEGVGYAIPISRVNSIIDELKTRKTRVKVDESERGYLGLMFQDIDGSMAEMYGMPEGPSIFKVEEGEAADNAGLHQHDIIVKVNGETVKTGEGLRKILSCYKAGETISITVKRLEEGEFVEREFEVTLGERPAEDEPA